MRTLIVTASSKTKRSTDEAPFLEVEPTFYNSLDKELQQGYLKTRNKLLDEFNFDRGPDTNPEIVPDDSIQYLPAYQRYSGRTFSKVSDSAWNTINHEPDSYDCVILSALYGLVRYNEPIRNYEIKQVTKMPSGQAIGKYWRDQGASDWLFNYIKNTDVDEVKFVLSTSYSDIVRKEKLMDRLNTELGISSEDKQFKQGGMKSMLLRGQYINDLLLDQLV